MKRIHYDSIHETLYQDVLKSGLKVYLLPKPSYHKTYVTLSTPLGSTTNRIQTAKGPLDLPAGIAHFLEHKLFDQNGEDVSTTFAMQSAQVNAYTMNERTTYLFSATDHLYDNMATLLDFVFHPQFTEAGIQKEIGIISQEIAMYEDDDNTAIYMGLMRQLYHHHPVQDDILGTQESIRTITKDLLETVHASCYHPSKMVLFVAGNVDPEEMMSWLHNQNLDTAETKPLPNPWTPAEPDDVQTTSGRRTMDIALPNALMGIKLPIDSDIITHPMKWELAFSIFCDMLIGKSTAPYQRFLREGLINDTFGLDITIESDYGFVLFGSHTTQPDAFLDALRQRIFEVDDATFDEAHFARAKQQIIGQFIQSLNSLEYIANQFTKYEFLGGSLFDVLDIANAITKEDILAVVPLLQQEQRISVMVIHPKLKEQPAT